MSVREWAKACGSCKSMFRLPLVKVDLTGNRHREDIPARGKQNNLNHGVAKSLDFSNVLSTLDCLFIG